jgi:hypothetical protein
MSEVRTAFQIWRVLFKNGYVPVGGPLFPESRLRRLLMAITPMGLLMLFYLVLSVQINAALAVALAAIGVALGWSPAGGGSPVATALVLLAAANFLAVLLHPIEEVWLEIGERIVPVRAVPIFIPRVRPR